MGVVTMRTRLFTAGIALLLGLSASYGQSRRVALSLQAGGAGHEENNLNVGLGVGLGLTVPLNAGLSATVEVDYWGTESRTSYRKLYNGRLQVMPFLIGIRYDFRGDGYFSPYAVAGGGYVGTKFRIGPLITIPEVTIDQSVRSGWAGYFGVGVLWRLSAFWDFFSEIDYLVRTAPGRTIIRDMNLGVSTDEIWINLHVVFWKFGLRFLI